MDDDVRGVPAEPASQTGPRAAAGAAEPEGTAERAGAVQQESAGEPGGTVAETVPMPSLGRSILIYTLIRVGLIVVLTAALFLAGRPFQMPLIVALAFAIVLQLPLSVVLFRGARNNLTAALARAKERRTAERDRLFTELTGEQRED